MRLLTTGILLAAAACATAQPDEYRGPIDPYYPNLHTPKLTTPQWFGEPGVEAVVILSIDDMREPEKYEAFLRPILDRLKKIDGRAPVSIFTNVVPPNHPQLQSWLAEGLSFEAHTRDHPCPLLGSKPLSWSKESYDTCVDQLAAIPGNKPVAFRMPCCDSQNTVSPRFYSEIFNKPTPAGNMLQIDSSVFNITTPNDPDLPRELVVDPDGREKFRKYLPFPSFVNTIEDYPYPYLIGDSIWEFPCAVPSDWEAQNLNKPDAQQSVDDMKAALDACVIKQGVYTLVFHPHNWIKNTQIVELIDHAVAKHGSKVKFINFREAAEQLRIYTHVEGEIETCTNEFLIDIDGDNDFEEFISEDGRSRVKSVKGGVRNYYRPDEQDYRLVDIDNDGDLDFLYSNEEACGLLLFEGHDKGWSKTVYASPRPIAVDNGIWPIPPFTTTKWKKREDQWNQVTYDQGAWFHSRHIWWQNENTDKLPDLVDRRSFNDLLQGVDLGPVEPAHAEKTMRVRPGYEVQLVAAEPLVSDPVSMAWGADGTLWVTEMHDYPSGMDGKGAPGSRIVRLEDVDRDGVYDKSTPFLEGLGFATGVMPWRDGALVTCAPDILFAKDTDGDGMADEVEKLFTGFGEGNEQHRINGLRWGLDNWVYCANGDSGGVIQSVATGEKLSINGRDFRFRPDTGEMQAISGQTQFGRVMNDWGDWFGSANYHPGWHYVLDETQLSRNPHFSAGSTYHELTEETQVYPISRLIPRFNDFHLANHFTSACGMDVYRDDLLGEGWRGDIFTCEPVHNLVTHMDISPDGATYIGTRAPGEEQREFLASTDNWFRPVAVRTGPDGALYVADMYRKEIEHPEYINEGDQAKSDFRAGSDRGRIYRVYPVGQRPAPPAPLNPDSLLETLDSPNGALRDLAHQILVERDDNVSTQLRALMNENQPAWGTLHTLGVLDGLHALEEQDLLAGMKHADPAGRRFVLQLAQLRLAGAPALAGMAIALSTDADALVRAQAAYALGYCPNADAASALAALIDAHLEDPIILTAALSSANINNLTALLPSLLRVLQSDAVSAELRASATVLVARTAAELPERLADFVSGVATGPAGAWRFLAMREVIDITAGHPLPQQANTVIADARTTLQDPAAEPNLRAAAAGLLGFDQATRPEDTALLCTLVDAREPVEVVQAALDRLRPIMDDTAIQQLLSAWPEYSPEIRRDVAGLLIGNDAGLDALLGAMETGAVSKRQLDPAQRQRLIHHRNEAIATRAEGIFADVGNPDRAAVIAQFSAAASLTGNAAHGRELFIERCATCHELGGVGHRVGPNLATVADRSFDKLLTSILDPNRGVEERYLNYEVNTYDLATYTGIVSAESSNSITLTGPDAVETVLLRTDIESMNATPLSPMPESLEEGLSLQDFADLIAFVSGSAAPPKVVEGNQPTTIKADDTGKLHCGANQAEIYGPTLTFSTQYQNLAEWTSLDDLAVWELDVPKAGEYSVRMEYCCDNRSANNPFLLQVAGETLTGHVAGTGTWNQYDEVLLGKLNLPAGKARLTFRAQEPPAGRLIELRSITLKTR
jgi:putative membrane-bound dehydrogenase-like protein